MDLSGVFADFAAGAGMTFPASLNELEERSSLGRQSVAEVENQRHILLIKRKESTNSKLTPAKKPAHKKPARATRTKSQMFLDQVKTLKTKLSKTSSVTDSANLNPHPPSDADTHVNTEMLESIWNRPIFW